MKIFCLLVGLSIAGCSPGNRPDMLGDTNLIAVEGNTSQELKAPENGRIAVYDMTAKQMLFTGAISAGQTFVIDPVALQANIDGRPATDKALPSGHELKVNFTRTD